MQIEAVSNPIHNTKNPEHNEVRKVTSEAGISFPRARSRNEQNDQLVRLQAELEKNDISLSYRHDDESNRLVITLVDRNTGETVRQIPDDVVLKLSSDIRGQFLNQTV